MDVYVYVLLVNVFYGIGNNDGIAIAQFGVVVLQVFFGFLVLALNELVAAEPVVETVLFSYSLQYTLGEDGTLQFFLGDDSVAYYVYLVYDDLAVFLYVDVYNHLVRCCGVVVLQDFYFCILESLVLKIALGKNFCPVDHVWRQLVVHHKAKLLLEVVPLAFLYTVVVDFGYARAWCQIYVQICGIADDGIHAYGDIGEKAVFPISLNGQCYFVAGYGNCLSDTYAGKTY